MRVSDANGVSCRIGHSARRPGVLFIDIDPIHDYVGVVDAEPPAQPYSLAWGRLDRDRITRAAAGDLRTRSVAADVLDVIAPRQDQGVTGHELAEPGGEAAGRAAGAGRAAA